MKNTGKYARSYFTPPECPMRWAQKEYIDRAPGWCSVDLRDGNQALVIPMGLEEKLDFFQFLVSIGFKEIEVGFPAASETEYTFCRALIEQKLIPEDVTIQVLTQSRPHIIEKTFEAIRGAENVIVHLYNSTSAAQREQVFKKSKEEIIDIALSGARLLQQYREKAGIPYQFEYSPESFTGTEPEFALEICNRVLDVWKPSGKEKVIINLPVTVELSLPHIYANQVEYISEHLHMREQVILSLHPHNDRGCAVADTELALLAGGERVEGTLFGNGERTGNVDIVTLALNLYSHGIDPQLDFSDMPAVVELYERTTGMRVGDRQPYGGKLVFAAFSGSHQDAIAKGMRWRGASDSARWNVPYLPIDPRDIGREYEADVIRINSQSGKGGIGYLLEQHFGFNLPPKMREQLGYTVKSVSDHQHKELSPQEVCDIFYQTYVGLSSPIELIDCHYKRSSARLHAEVSVRINGEERLLPGEGNGRLDSVSNAFKQNLGISYSNLRYTEHALETGSTARAAAYVGIQSVSGETCWGAGVHEDIIMASIIALTSAINRLLSAGDRENAPLH
ncbi:MAG: 2-isopropylmalate synthase [Provencibacterium sp.]|jgi:2-isopropylmalate synthase|nr:2-isopropylmalate synthase [Provencibacterium sp.]